MKQFQPLILTILLFSLLLSGTAVAGSVAMEQMKQTVDEVIEQLRMKDQDSDVRKQKISSLVMDRFDFTTMAKRAMGQNWRRMKADQQEIFAKRFATLLKASYLGRIDAYTNETVEFVNEQSRSGKVLIETEIVTATNRIPMHYKMHEKTGQWLVYDVVVEGVSLIRNYRNTYNSIYRNDGFDGLIQQMDQKIAEL